MVLARKPPLMPAITPSQVVFLLYKIPMTTGPKAEPRPDHDNKTKSNITRGS